MTRRRGCRRSRRAAPSGRSRSCSATAAGSSRSGPRARAGSCMSRPCGWRRSSLVQAVAASGVAVLAFATARGHPSRLARREQLAVVLAIAGLVLLALSLVDTSESDQHPPVIGIIIWLAACGGGAVLLIAIPTRFGRAASLGLAAGLLFADGDISAKLVGYGGWWLLALAHAHRRLRRRDERPAVGLPAGRRADRGRYRDDGRPTRSRSRPGSCCSARRCRTGCEPSCRSPRSRAWSWARSCSATSSRPRPTTRSGRPPGSAPAGSTTPPAGSTGPGPGQRRSAARAHRWRPTNKRRQRSARGPTSPRFGRQFLPPGRMKPRAVPRHRPRIG